MIKKAIMRFTYSANAIFNYINIKRKKVIVGKKLTINGKISLHGSGRIIIGDNVTIHSKPSVNPTAGAFKTFLVANDSGTIKIGNNVGMSKVCITSHNSVTIEDNVLLGDGVKIWDTDFHSLSYDERVSGNDTPKTAPVLIKEGAFIGACSIILKGVTVGKHSIVGAGSVVTKDIPDGEVWAGNPARCVKRVIDNIGI